MEGYLITEDIKLDIYRMFDADKMRIDTTEFAQVLDYMIKKFEIKDADDSDADYSKHCQFLFLNLM